MNMQVFPCLALWILADRVESEFGLSQFQPSRSVIPIRRFSSLNARLSLWEQIESFDAVCHIADSYAAEQQKIRKVCLRIGGMQKLY